MTLFKCPKCSIQEPHPKDTLPLCSICSICSYQVTMRPVENDLLSIGEYEGRQSALEAARRRGDYLVRRIERSNDRDARRKKFINKIMKAVFDASGLKNVWDGIEHLACQKQEAQKAAEYRGDWHSAEKELNMCLLTSKKICKERDAEKQMKQTAQTAAQYKADCLTIAEAELVDSGARLIKTKTELADQLTINAAQTKERGLLQQKLAEAEFRMVDMAHRTIIRPITVKFNGEVEEELARTKTCLEVAKADLIEEIQRREEAERAEKACRHTATKQWRELRDERERLKEELETNARLTLNNYKLAKSQDNHKAAAFDKARGRITYTITPDRRVKNRRRCIPSCLCKECINDSVFGRRSCTERRIFK